MKILVACEESQVVCKAFRELGHEAYSCDIQKCSGGHNEWHIMQDVIPLLNGNCEIETVDGTKHKIEGEWDLIIAHPPCTYLTVTGNRWFNVERYGEKAIQRIQNREEAVKFFMAFVNADCQRICIENPVGCMSTRWRKADQIINPTMFGDPFDKKTCLWLIGLEPLAATNIVKAEPRIVYDSGKTMPAWYANSRSMSKEERSKFRSKTFPGIASAMAEQWG